MHVLTPYDGKGLLSVIDGWKRARRRIRRWNILLEKQFLFGYLIRALMPRGTAMSVRTLVMASFKDFFCSLVTL